MKAIIKACENLKLQFRVVNKLNNFIEVTKNGNKYYFIQASTPSNSVSSVSLATDKYFSYQLFGEDLNIPKTKDYLNPDCDEKYKYLTQFSSQEEISKDIEKSFAYPLIVKMNRGNQGHNVFLCNNKKDVELALKSIFDSKVRYYDYVALAQEYIDVVNEYRVVWYKGDVVLVYEKVSKDKKQNLSPLHNDSGKAVYVNDESIINRIKKHIYKAHLETTFDFLGIDLVIDNKDEMYVLELNTRPGFSYFIRDNGDEKLVGIYEKMLADLS